MHDKNKSQSAFDEIRDYSVEQMSKLVGNALAHTQKSCNEQLSDFSAKSEDKEIADQVLGYLTLNSKPLTTLNPRPLNCPPPRMRTAIIMPQTPSRHTA